MANFSTSQWEDVVATEGDDDTAVDDRHLIMIINGINGPRMLSSNASYGDALTWLVPT